MKYIRLFLILPLFIIFVIPIGAETVMVMVDHREKYESEEVDTAYFLSAVEAGLMDPFFDAGHIVFNAYPSAHSPDNKLQKQYEAIQTAEKGGASFLLKLDFEYRVEEESKNLFPLGASYRFFQVSPKKVLEAGEVKKDEVELKKEPASTEEICFFIGRLAAQKVLNAW